MKINLKLNLLEIINLVMKKRKLKTLSIYIEFLSKWGLHMMYTNIIYKKIYKKYRKIYKNLLAVETLIIERAKPFKAIQKLETFSLIINNNSKINNM